MQCTGFDVPEGALPGCLQAFQANETALILTASALAVYLTGSIATLPRASG